MYECINVLLKVKRNTATDKVDRLIKHINNYIEMYKIEMSV